MESIKATTLCERVVEKDNIPDEEQASYLGSCVGKLKNKLIKVSLMNVFQNYPECLLLQALCRKKNSWAHKLICLWVPFTKPSEISLYYYFTDTAVESMKATTLCDRLGEKENIPVEEQTSTSKTEFYAGKMEE